MVSNFKRSDFDFHYGNRVRFRGKVQSKVQLSYLIGCFDSYSVYSIYVDFPYEDYCRTLEDLVYTKLD